MVIKSARQLLARRCGWKTFRRFASFVRKEDSRPLDKIRNIGVSAHIDSGKTTVTERILFYAGRIEEMHEVKGKDRVGATMDYMELERLRGITIQSAATYIDWKGTNINIIDTPGHVDFTVEVERALRVLDGAILVLCGVGGIQSQTFTVNRQMARYAVPCIAFVNKLDRMNANHHRVLDGLRRRLGHNAALLQLPIGKESAFCGIVDLINEKAIYFDEPEGLSLREDEIPQDMRAEARDKRAELIEHAASGDEQLAGLFIEEKTPTVAELIAGIRRACLKRQFVPVLVGSALKNKGVQPLLDAVLRYLPNPGERTNVANVMAGEVESKVELIHDRDSKNPTVALAFKLEAGKFGQLTYFRVYQGRMVKGGTLYNTRDGRKARLQRLIRMHADDMQDIDVAFAGDICATFGVDCASGDTYTSDPNFAVSMEAMHVPEPVVSMSCTPKSKKDVENFTKALTRFTKEDPTFRKHYDTESKETIVSGMGELHLEVYGQRMESEFNCAVVLGKPKVAFRETLAQPFQFAHFHKRQTGGRGQYGKINGVIEPLPAEHNTKNKFSDETSGSDLPKTYVPAIQKGFIEKLAVGPLIGQKVTGINFRLQSGACHEVDSSDLAFQNAAKGAMNDVYEDGTWVLLEPLMKLEVSAPVEHRSPITRALQARLAVVVNEDILDEQFTVLTCEVPLNNMFGYASELRRFTEGKGEFTMEYSRYVATPTELQQELVRKYMIETGKIDLAAEKKKAEKKARYKA